MDGGGGEGAASPPFFLPTGVKFQPTDVELVDFYLRRRLAGISPPSCLIGEADVYEYEPQDLFAKHGHSFVRRKDETEMYFFTPRHPAGGPGSRRVSRTVAGGSGLWDGRARDTLVMSEAGDEVIGHKMQLKFKCVKGGSREKENTNWLMHEYRIESGDNKFVDLALCRIYHKGGAGNQEGGGEENSRAAKRQRVVEDQEEAGSEEAAGSESNMTMVQMQSAWDHGASFSAAVAAAAGDKDYCNGEHSQMLREGDAFCIDVELGTQAPLWEHFFPGGDKAFTIDEYGMMVPRHP